MGLVERGGGGEEGQQAVGEVGVTGTSGGWSGDADICIGGQIGHGAAGDGGDGCGRESGSISPDDVALKADPIKPSGTGGCCVVS